MDAPQIPKPKNRVMPNECIVPIWCFLSTCDLLRFLSNKITKPLLTEQFTHCLEEVLQHRLPLGIKLAGNRLVVVDCANQTVAVIKRWSAFSFSVACGLVELISFRLPFSFSSRRGGFDELDWPLSREWEWRRTHRPQTCHRYERHSSCTCLASVIPLDQSVAVRDLFSSLQNLREISVDICTHTFPCVNFIADQLNFIFCHALPQIRSLNLTTQNAPNLACEMSLFDILSRTRCLEELHIFVYQLSVFSLHSGVRSVADLVAPRLNCFAIAHEGDLDEDTWTDAPHFVTECSDLTELSLCLVGSVRSYLAAFRELPKLIRLSLEVFDAASASFPLPKPATDECPVVATVERRSMSFPWKHLKEVYFASLLPKFSNIQELTLVLQAVRGSRFISVADILLFIGGTEVLPHLRSLTLINKHKWTSHRIRLADLHRVLAGANIPDKIDLSEFGCVYLREKKSLIQLYQTQRRVLLVSLTIRVSVNAAAFALMETFFMKEFGGNAAHLGDFVTAWIPQGVPVPPGPAKFVWAPHRYYAPTDFLIRGRKTAGRNGMPASFSLRIVNNRS